MRFCLVGAAALVASLSGGGAGPSPTPGGGGVQYTPPLSPLQVVRGFDPPATPYGPGHRGVDLAASSGTQVRTVGAGVVSFAGPVAGRGIVVVAHADGVRTEYEPVRPTVRVGEPVHGGEVIGVVRGRHGDCAPGTCLHWGARRGEEYFDPLLLLRPLGQVRLLPWHEAHEAHEAMARAP